VRAALGAILATLLIAAPIAAEERRVRLAAPNQPPADAPPDHPADATPAPPDRLHQHRNLGKALYENPATQYEAVAEFEAALALAPDSAPERVNLGLALLRAGRTDEGIAQLTRAQKQDPTIPHTWFNLGIAYKKASEYEKAIAQLEGMAERVPDEPITHYNLGVLHKLQGDPEASLRHFERAAELDPGLAGPHFQLASAYRQAGRAEDAAREMERFRELKARDAGAAVPEDLEWSWYAEIYEAIEPEPRPGVEAEPAFELTELAGGLDPESAGLLVLRADGSPVPALLAWSAQGLRLLHLDAEAAGPATPNPVPDSTAAPADPGTASPAEPGLGGLRGVRHAAAGDFDNDGRHDLAVLTGRAHLLANRDGRFEPVETLPEAAKRSFDLAVWLDYDHDYDLDLLLLGAEPVLLRNDGPGSDGVTWSDRTDAFPFAALAGGGRITAAARFDLVADTQGIDLAVAREGAPAVLFRDLLGGRYEATELPELPAGTRHLVAADADHDGWTDLVASGAGGVTVLRSLHRHARHLGFEAIPIATAARAGAGAPDAEAGASGETGGEASASGAAPAPAGPVVVFDLANRGAGDLVVGDRIFRDLGDARFADGQPLLGLPEDAPAVTVLAAADLDGDGRTDLVGIDTRGTLVGLLNRTETAHGSLRIALTGVKNPVLAPSAEVEVKAGSLYQKQLYDGVPLVFGLGGREQADAVRITWPNGLIQNETRQPAGTQAAYEEAQRLSGSCPMIFTWNGEEFLFITDVLGVAPLGASAGDGEYFPVDHDEVIQVPGEALVATPEGRYEVRITEELREVAFLDQVRLLAVDHPAGLDVYTNDKFKGPPFPEFRLFGVAEAERRYPVAARDHHGRDVRERLLARDETYPDGFRRDYSGLAELHHLELDFGLTAVDRAILVLSGWVDWADGSTFLATAQGEGPGLVLPYLQVKDEAGEWVTVIEDMGIPAGKPKTIVVDLTGKFLSEGREVRIVTSACVYWDEIFLAEDALTCHPDEWRNLGGGECPLRTGQAPTPPVSPDAASCRLERSEAESRDLGGGVPPLCLAEVPVAETHLRFRGFSRPVIHPERKQPERFVYADRRPTTMWNPTPGRYTRYGDVAELLATVDDRFVVMGSGDEVSLSFDARALPPPPAGWRRDFLLVVDGWAKDGDANTAHSQTVGPLPYHGMPQYPYDQPHAYPDTPEHRLYQEHYLTRPALRLIRPLTEGTPADPRADR
jgi:tetratricopeptide (TPR) repeat protein